MPVPPGTGPTFSALAIWRSRQKSMTWQARCRQGQFGWREFRGRRFGRCTVERRCGPVRQGDEPSGLAAGRRKELRHPIGGGEPSNWLGARLVHVIRRAYFGALCELQLRRMSHAISHHPRLLSECRAARAGLREQGRWILRYGHAERDQRRLHVGRRSDRQIVRCHVVDGADERRCHGGPRRQFHAVRSAGSGSAREQESEPRLRRLQLL